MRSSHLHLEQYDTDKFFNHYLEHYDPVFDPWLDKKITLLELGINKGGSLLLWHDYFPLGSIVGIDIKLPKEFAPTERIHMYKGNQADRKFLSRVANEVAPEGFDIIIDDASHIGTLTKIAFWHLFDNHLKPNGLYVVEDWGTGYWDNWLDGKGLDLESSLQPDRNLFWYRIAEIFRLKIPMRCHSYGMVGFVKQLVDEQCAFHITEYPFKGQSRRPSKFQSITITPGLVFIKKAVHLEPRVDGGDAY